MDKLSSFHEETVLGKPLTKYDINRPRIVGGDTF